MNGRKQLRKEMRIYRIILYILSPFVSVYLIVNASPASFPSLYFVYLSVYLSVSLSLSLSYKAGVYFFLFLYLSLRKVTTLRELNYCLSQKAGIDLPSSLFFFLYFVNYKIGFKYWKNYNKRNIEDISYTLYEIYGKTDCGTRRG